MKREDVKTHIPGITDEGLNWLMNENGADINREKAKAEALQQQLDTANSTITGLRDTAKQYNGVDVTELQKQITDGKAKYDQDIANMRRDYAIDLELTARRARSLKAARAMLDMDKIKPDKDGRYTGITEQLDALEKSDGYLFNADAKPGTGVTVSTGGEHGTGGDAGATDGVAAAFASLNPDLKL